MTAFIETLINDLAQEAFAQEDVFNQYAFNDPHNAIRRHNLRHYLGTLAQAHPSHLLVMEAPGYRGCRLTGIPVTSRKIVAEGVPTLGIFGTADYQQSDDAGFENIYGEQSATIVWETLAQLQVLPLIWNTFPFHPCKTGQARSNRRPRMPERRLGLTYLRRIIAHYQPQQIIAVGNVAYETMHAHDIVCDKVRHPAQGGKSDFVAGIKRYLT